MDTLQYFRMANISSKLKTLDGWLRNRIRYCIWYHWNRIPGNRDELMNIIKNKQFVNKKRERKRISLLRLGINPDDAFSWSRTRKGGWAVAQSPILGTTITIDRLIKRGYESLLDYYSAISLSGNEPLYTRPVRTVVLRQTQYIM